MMRSHGLIRALLVAAAVFIVIAALGAAAPPDAQAVSLPGVDIGIPNPFDVGLPGVSDLVKKVFGFFFKTFFGIEAKVTRRVVEWLVAAPVYTDQAQYAQLNELRAYVSVAAWALTSPRRSSSRTPSGCSASSTEPGIRNRRPAGTPPLQPE